MWQDIVRILIVLVLAWGAYSLNNILNPHAKAKQILGIVIICVGALFLIAPIVDVIRIALDSVHS
jgi:hypothetical protein